MERLKYDYKYLTEYCKQNKIILNKDYSVDKINRDTIIEAKCIYENCNDFIEFKTFRRLCKIGCYCKYHIKLICLEKRKKTCMKKYGVESALQSKEVRDKGKKLV